MASLDPPSKHQAFLALLQEGRPSLHLDARREGVIVPAHLKADAHLVLQYGIDLPIPITDLVVDDSGVRATLSFSRTPHQTFVPWPAVYVIATDDGRGVLYPDDVPSDVAIVPARADGDPEISGAGPRGRQASGIGDAVDDAAMAAPDGAELGGELPESMLEGAEGRTDGRKGSAGAQAQPPASPRRTLRSVPLEVVLPDPGTVPELDVEQVASSLASSGGAETVSGPRRRRKPQLRLVK
jgi:stringent starvation protein B